MNSLSPARVARANFQEARRRALVAALHDLLRGQPAEMLSFADVRARLNVRGQRYLGQHAVAIDHIIGSEGRYGDFDRRFLPRSNKLVERWSSIDQARLRSIELPPVDLYKIGDVYFVRDGNHRVSVARQQGVAYIDANIVELIVDIPLGPELSMRDLLMKEEYSDFLEWTDLHTLRPDERIEFSELGGYLDLVRHINAHRYYLGQQLQRDIGREEAVADWYDSVYLPIVRVIREQHLLRQFSGRTEADLYRWIMDHRWYMLERSGADPGPEAAAAEYVALFGRKSLAGAVDSALRAVLRRLLPHDDAEAAVGESQA
ncbi:MAG TPA: DUF4032 domain-containing protein [Roseiflexaceae bacterium]|nr:DUF4032 domain-containing protein [Roseiflexaceae bacterium]